MSFRYVHTAISVLCLSALFEQSELTNAKMSLRAGAPTFEAEFKTLLSGSGSSRFSSALLSSLPFQF